jgi:hypothetical protein
MADRERELEASDDEEHDEERPERRQRREGREQLAGGDLAGLIRLIGARGRILVAPERARATTNADLIQGLRDSGMLGR